MEYGVPDAALLEVLLTGASTTCNLVMTRKLNHKRETFPGSPMTNNFNVQVLSAGTEQSVVRVMDLQGRVLKTMNVSANETVNLGSDLRAGAYIVEVRQGNSVKTTRVLKF